MSQDNPARVAYSPDIAARIVDLMADTPLATIATMPGMPARATIYQWRAKYPEFNKACQVAQLLHADSLADEVVHIADTEKDPQRSRVMVEARKWRSGVIKPQQYGPRLELAVSSEDPAELHRQGQRRVLAMRPQSDPAIELLPQVIDGAVIHAASATDSQSDALAPAPLSIFD